MREAFEWMLLDADTGRATVGLANVSAAVLVHVPDAAFVLVSAQLGVQVLNEDHLPLCVEALPLDVAVTAASLFGVGMYALERPGRPGCPVRAPWRPVPKRSDSGSP